MEIQKYVIRFTLLIIGTLVCLPSIAASNTSGVKFKGDYQVLATVSFSELYSGFVPGAMHLSPGFQTIGDLNNDGIKDYIITPFLYDLNAGMGINAQVYTAFFVSNGKGKLVNNTSLFNSIPQRVNGREGIVADFNGDLKNDFFDAAHGMDELIIGEQNILLLSTPQGTLTDVSYTHLPLLNDFSHGAGAGDIDGDGDIDIFIANNALLDAYFLINDGTGNFSIDDSSSRISKNLIKYLGVNSGTNAMYLTAKFFDMNGDGAVDLLLASHANEENYANFNEFYYSRLVYLTFRA